jgi:Elongation factor P (EF-P) KOW-like domain
MRICSGILLGFALCCGSADTTTAFVPSFSCIGSRTTTSLQVAVDTSEIKNGMTIEIDNEPYKVLTFSIMKQARGECYCGFVELHAESEKWAQQGESCRR